MRPTWSSASHTPMAGAPAPSRVTSASRASGGHGTGSGAVSAASRSTVAIDSGSPAWAAAAAARSTSVGSFGDVRALGEHDLGVVLDDAVGERAAYGPAGRRAEACHAAPHVVDAERDDAGGLHHRAQQRLGVEQAQRRGDRLLFLEHEAVRRRGR